FELAVVFSVVYQHVRNTLWRIMASVSSLEEKMAITINNKYLSNENFDSEKELQLYLERNPDLLMSEVEPRVIFSKRELYLPAAGILDMFCIDESGTPIAVEVKLARNSQSRREVVAQAFDYVSDLSTITIDELDDIVSGDIEDAINKCETEINLWRICGTNLRAGVMKVIIAVDEANDDLVRIVRYINDHSDLDVRLVAISKFNSGEILVPNIIVSGNQGNQVKSVTSRSSESRVGFNEFIFAYNSQAESELKTRNNARNYRVLAPNNWPKPLHYEFIDYSNEIGVEIHIEKDGLGYVRSLLEGFTGKTVCGYSLNWDEKWSKRRGRLFARIPVSLGNDTCIQAMNELVGLTRESIDTELTKALR
ncbi:hypothetical protein, partial [Photobacterium swingsii]|uniref:hypothetical protein n=1 Tax=Photobacterium swingsii TaxID=680026 RepID=UPI0040689613